MDEQRLRERLTGLANEIPPVGSAPAGLIPKARRRAYVMPALALLCVIAAAIVTFAGVRAVLGAQASVPAVPRPHPGAPSEDHVFVVFDLSGRPGLAASADVDGDPPGYTVIRPEGNLWPLDRTDDGRLAFTGFDHQGLFVLGLPIRQRTAVVLRFYEDLSEAQIAEVLRCRPGTVKSLISRGLDALRERVTVEG